MTMLNKILIGILLSSSTVAALAGTVPVDLYRGGNSTSPRMDNVREQDIVWYLNDGQQWVVGKKGGISTTSKPPVPGKNWWKIPKGTKYSDEIYLENDHDNHWRWAPAKNMSRSHFKGLMQNLHPKFKKIN